MKPEIRDSGSLTTPARRASQCPSTRFIVDRDHSNTYEAWKKMGSPQPPSAQQYAELEKAGELHQIAMPNAVTATKGEVAVTLTLPRQGVSLVKLTW